MIGVKPLFSGSSLNDNDTANFEVAMVAPDGKQIAATGLKWQLLSVESKYQWYRSNGYWSYEPIKVTRRVADGTLDVCRRQAGQDRGTRHLGPLPARSDERLTRKGPRPPYGFDSGLYADVLGRHAGPARDRSRQEGV